MLLQILNDTINQVINDVVNTGIAIHQATGGGEIINGVNNSVTSGLITIVVALVVRFFEKRKIHKKYGK